MKALKLARLIGAMTVMASAPALLAVAVHAQQSPPSTEGTPPASRPELAPRPVPIEPQRPSGPSVQEQKPGLPGAPGTLPNTPSRPQAGAPPAEKTGPEALVGLAVFGSDGQKVGEVRNVKAEPDGKVTEIHVKTGGFLGFGGKTVAIPAAKFNKSGQNVQLAMTSTDVTKLPIVGDKPS